jgi:hypothetical protein
MKPKNRLSPAKPKIQQPRVIRKKPQKKTVITKNRTISYILSPAPRKAKKVIKSGRPKGKIGRDILVKKDVIVRRKEPVIRKAKRTDIDVRTPRKSRIVKQKTTRIAIVFVTGTAHAFLSGTFARTTTANTCSSA